MPGCTYPPTFDVFATRNTLDLDVKMAAHFAYALRDAVVVRLRNLHHRISCRLIKSRYFPFLNII